MLLSRSEIAIWTRFYPSKTETSIAALRSRSYHPFEISLFVHQEQDSAPNASKATTRGDLR